MPPITDPTLLAQIKQQQVGAPPMGPSQLSGPMPMTAPMVNPHTQFTEGQSSANLDLAREAADRAAIALGYTGAADRRAQEEADRKKAEAALTGGVDTTEAENTAAFLTTQLSGHVNKINEVLKEHPEAIKPGWMETIGGVFGDRTRAMMTPDKVQDVRNTLNNRYSLAADVLLTLGTGAAYTAEQKKAYVESYSPKVTDGPETLADKKEMMREAVIAARTKSGAAVGQIDRALAQIDELYKTPEVPETTPEGPKQLSTETKAGKLPEGYLEEHAALFGKYKPGQMTVSDYMQIRNYLAETHGGWGQGLDPNDAKAAVDFYNKTGKVPRPIAEDVPLTKEESEAAKFSSSPLGTGAASFANAATMGAVDMAVGQEGRDASNLAEEKNWKSALAGDVLGSIAPMAGIERGGVAFLKKLAPKLSTTARMRLLGDIGVNSAYGGARGYAGADEGEGLAGTAEGVAGGALGAAGGNFVAKGVNPLLSDATQQALDKLKGVKLTTLQKLGLGRGEQSLSAVPFAHGAREKAIESFNRDNASRVLQRIGVKLPKNIPAGTELNAFVNKELNNAYNVIRPQIVGNEDGTFVSNLKNLYGKASITPEKKAMWKEIQTAIDSFRDKTTGAFDGQGYKEASERLRFLSKTWMNEEGNVPAKDMGKVAEQVRREMQQVVQRRAPPDVGQKLKALERSWKHQMIIEDASNAALRNNDATYSSGQLLTSQKKLETNKNMAARGQAFDQEYALAAQKIMGPGNVGSLSVRDTALTSAGLTGVGIVNPAVTAAMAAMVAGVYGPGVKKITQAILSGQRPSAVDNEIVRRALADAIRHQSTGE